MVLIMNADTLHSFAAKRRDELLNHLEKINKGRGNRASVFTLVKLATSPERAKLVLEALEEENFLDGSPEPEDRYAWDLTLHAVKNWAVMATTKSVLPQEDQVKASASHTTLCALDSNTRDWLRRASDELEGYDEGDQSLKRAKLALGAWGQRLVDESLVSPEAVNDVIKALDDHLEATAERAENADGDAECKPGVVSTSMNDLDTVGGTGAI